MKKILIIFTLLLGIITTHGMRYAVMQDEIEDTIAVDTVAVDSVLAIPQMTVQERIARLLEADMFQTSQVGLMIYDLTADTLVFARNEKQTMRPASTMKLTTAIAALDRLGGSYRYATSLGYKGAIYDASEPGERRRSNVLIGNIIVTGGMDPRFGTDDMNALVEALEKEHIDTIYGEIIEDRSFKDGELLGEGWCWDDDNPVLTPLPWKRKDDFCNKLLQCIRSAGIVVRPKSEIPCDSLGNRLYVSQRETSATLNTRYHTLDQILMKMMKDSDNLYAESMLYQIASDVTKGRRPARAKDGIEVIKGVMRSAGINPAKYRIADGSGLSLYNYQSAEMQVAMLRYAFRNSNIYEYLYPSLPIAGVDGTLKSRMGGTKARGNVHAKTGTVTGVSSLAGYLKADNGNIICFSIINQGMLRTAPAKAFQDKVCTIMCGY